MDAVLLRFMAGCSRTVLLHCGTEERPGFWIPTYAGSCKSLGETRGSWRMKLELGQSIVSICMCPHTAI